MQATFILLGPGGGKYTLDFELPALPKPGDHIFISGPYQNGTESFVVRRRSWHLHHPARREDEGGVGEIHEITIECEPAKEWAPSWE